MQWVPNEKKEQPEQEPDDLTIAYMAGFHAGKNTPQRKPEQEPVAWMNDSTPSGIFARHMEGAKNFGCTIPLYTSPQRTWVGLTEEEIDSVNCVEKLYIGEGDSVVDPETVHEFARFIEAKLREKNT
jgi:hypothetical protein